MLDLGKKHGFVVSVSRILIVNLVLKQLIAIIIKPIAILKNILDLKNFFEVYKVLIKIIIVN